MARARWLKPEFFEDRKMAEIGPVGALVYQALWCLADDTGVALCDPELLKARMFSRWSAVGVPEITGALRELLALYSMATLMVTNDSGPAHFASLLQLPTVVLFGPETPRLYGPMGNAHKDLYAEFACSPCVSVYNGKKSPCTENRCLKEITVDQVLKEALVLLSETSKEKRSSREKPIGF